jgi:hypothetical protein
MSEESETHYLKTAGIAAVVLLALLFGGFLVSQKLEQKKRVPPEKLIVFEGLQKDIKVEAFLKNSRSTAPLFFQDDALVLTDKQMKDFTLPYEIAAKLTDAGGNMHDLSWRVDSEGVQYDVELDGFASDDRISFSIGDSYGLKKIPFDWSGKIVLNAFLIKTENLKACVDVYSQQDFRFCHFLTGKAGGK